MIGRAGLVSSVTLHALFVAVVWVFTGLSFSDDVREEPVRIVRIVPGDRETVAGPPRTEPARRAVAPRPAAKAVAGRPMRPPRATLPVPEPEVVEAVAPVTPEPEPVTPEPVAATPPPAVAEDTTVPAPVTPPPADAPITASTPAGEPPAPAARAPKEPVDGTDEPSPEDARAVARDGSAPRPEPAWLQAVTSDPTVAAKARGEPFLGRREVFEFLLDNLEFASHVTRALRLGRYKAWQTAEGLVLDDGWGSLLNLSVVQATNGARVLYARGHYRQPLLPNIHGQAVLRIEWDTTPADGGRDMISAAVTTYAKVESGFMALLMKLASATVTDKAELESRRVVRTFARVSRAIEDDPAKVFEQVRRSPDVPQAQLEQFRRLLKVP